MHHVTTVTPQTQGALTPVFLYQAVTEETFRAGATSLPMEELRLKELAPEVFLWHLWEGERMSAIGQTRYKSEADICNPSLVSRFPGGEGPGDEANASLAMKSNFLSKC